MHFSKLFFQLFFIIPFFFANLVASVSSDSSDSGKKSIVLILTKNHTPFAQKTDTRSQPVLKASRIPGRLGQEDLIDAINTGNVDQFKLCLERGDDYQAKNLQGISPEYYLACYCKKSFNLSKAQHQKMQVILHEHRVFALENFSQLFDR